MDLCHITSRSTVLFFNSSGLGTSFFADDFENGVDHVTVHLDALNFDYQIVKLKSPGATSSATLSSDRYGSALHGDTVCTQSIPGSCSTSLDVKFDELELGFLPQAVGIAIDNLALYAGATSSLVAFDSQNQPVATVTAIGTSPLTIFPTFSGSDGDEPIIELPPNITYPDYVPPGYTFLGVSFPGGISRIFVGGNVALVSEIQYGLLAPEPSMMYLLFATAMSLAAVRYRRR